MNVIKRIFSIKTIMCIRLLFGLYYKISSNRWIMALSKIYCAYVAMAIMTYNFSSIQQVDIIRVGLQVPVVMINVLVNMFGDSENFPALLNKLREIDDSQHGLTLNDAIPVSWILLTVSMGIRLTTHAIFCSTSKRCFYTVLTTDLMSITTHFTRIMMFELLWRRMKLIRKRFERESRISRWANDEQGTAQRLRKYMICYRNLLNTTRLTNATMKPLIFLSIMVAIPKLLNIIYSVISAEGTYRHFTTTLEGLSDFAISIASAAVAENVNREIDKLNLCFIKQLLHCRGEPARDAVEDAMMYLRQRPFKYTVWRLFSMDTSMILSVVGLLTTYTVAMVQFAHFYD